MINDNNIIDSGGLNIYKKQGAINLSSPGGTVILDGKVTVKGCVGISSWDKIYKYFSNGFDPSLTGETHSTITMKNGASIEALGDGGNYSIYANRWNNKINSFYSVATGVEVIERNKEVVLNHDYDKVAVYSIDASDDFILRSMDRLYEEYDTVSYNGEVRNISKLLKKIQKNYTHFVVLGSNEELKNELEVKNLRSRDSVKIKLDQPRTRIRK